LNIAIVVSEFNDKVTSKMLDIALEKAKSLKLNVKFTCKVPGVFDMPLIVDTLLEAVIKGQTKHDELIANATVKRLTKLSLKHKKPVSLGITGPGMGERQAHARIRPVSERAIEAVLKISQELEKIR
jgi:6,7-dimethyl-8-ribityllumazine synthase